jgi:hypothetical protein
MEKAPPPATRNGAMTESMTDDRGLNRLILNPNLTLITRTRLLMAET